MAEINKQAGTSPQLSQQPQPQKQPHATTGTRAQHATIVAQETAVAAAQVAKRQTEQGAAPRPAAHPQGHTQARTGQEQGSGLPQRPRHENALPGLNRFSEPPTLVNTATHKEPQVRSYYDSLPKEPETAEQQPVRKAVQKSNEGKATKKRSLRTEQEPRGFHISKTVVLMVITFAVLLVSSATVFFLLNSFLFGQFEDVEMPNFDGKNVSEIQYNEEYKGFHLVYEDVFTDEEPVGEVVGQNPRAPRSIKENSKVILYVSAGTRKSEVPNVTKLTREQAKQALKEAGLNVIFKPVTDTTVAPDTVLNTVPVAGQAVSDGETVQVYFARAESSVKIKVPECVGLATLSEAIRALATEGFGYELSADSVGDGSVTAQLPEAGEMMPRGTKITLTVSGSTATGLDALPEKQVTGADGHVHAYAPTTVVSPNEYSIGYTIYACTICNYFYYDDYTPPSAG